MDLSRTANDRKLYLCKWYFNVGLIFLPFLWAINCVWFFSEAFRKPPYEEQQQIKKYVILSAIGTAIWSVILMTWIILFQTNRANWSFADNISFVIPLGQK